MQVYSWEIALLDSISSLRGKSTLIDSIMLLVSSEVAGFATLFTIGSLLFLRWNRKKIFSYASLTLSAFVLADLLSRLAFKRVFQRPRPDYLHTGCEGVSRCFGFVSSHATDIFALITIFFIIDRRHGLWGYPLALLVCYSRLHLEEHFPLDIIGGAVLGSGVSLVVYYGFYRKKIQSIHSPL